MRLWSKALIRTPAAAGKLGGPARSAALRALGLIAIAAGLPLLIFGAVSLVRGVEAESARITAEALDDARLLCALDDNELNRLRDEARALADSADLAAGVNLATAERHLSRRFKHHSQWLAVQILDVATLKPVLDLPAGADLGAGLLQAAERDPSHVAVGGVHPLKPTGVAISALTPPAPAGAKLVTVLIRPDRFQSLLAAFRWRPGWIVTVVDQNGRVVARSALRGRFLAAPASANALGARRRALEGVYAGVTLEGTPTLSAFSRSARSGWSVHVGIPRRDLEAPVRRAAAILGLSFLASLLLGLFFLQLLMREVRTRRAQDAALEQGVRLEALGRLTGGVAHDFNNFLMIIRGNTDILRRRLVDERALPRLDAIDEATDRAAKLIRQMLVFAKGGGWETSTLDLNDVVRSSLGTLRQLAGDRCEVRVSPAEVPTPTDVDPIQLEAAVLNLAANARDAMPQGGRLELFSRDAGAFVEIGVADSGEGIAPHLLSRVFEPFFTTKPLGVGTGLGLAQVYGFARHAGGEARIESVVGRGTTVILRLPRAQAAVPSGPPIDGATATAPGPATPGAGPRVLLVDDNAAVRRSLAGYLGACGLTITEARDAREALQRLEDAETPGTDLERQLPAPPFEAVVCDIVMPGEMDGLGLARELHQRRPELPLILVSGYGRSVEEARRSGFTVLAKPLEPAELERMLRQVCAPAERPLA